MNLRLDLNKGRFSRNDLNYQVRLVKKTGRRLDFPPSWGVLLGLEVQRTTRSKNQMK